MIRISQRSITLDKTQRHRKMSVFRTKLFEGCVAIVTGGATGIGRAITYELLTLGCKVVISSRNGARLKATVEEFSNVGTITSTVCNIRKENDVRNLISTTIARHGRLDFIVNNGGGQFLSPAADISLKGWNAVTETNLTGTFLVCREAFNQWFDKNGGVIVNIIADMWRGFPMMSHTGAARHAVFNLTQSLAIEWADKGVRINSVAPGLILSPTAAANYERNIFDEVKGNLPAKRAGLPEEISSAVCFLLSPGAAYISGATLRVDGGSSLYTTMFWNVPDHKSLKAYNWIPPAKL
ncbi:peroxisomal trans-2-enoyl-CoA reductase-like [Bradysia coprophila]|uniref:peroxisomal trans-2-enoyl-CoA reductase-like n=1 Tax=Bradysia coprophila TaxID=38358 RepID=UPI00187D81D3|nr:peroxisomal trans-2-enoyl-CoA reductase-like [Bradysia coprophila]